MDLSLSGSGQTILFIHGFCENMKIWNAYEKELSNRYQIALVDLPGHGKSSIQESAFDLEDIAIDIHRLLLKNGISEYFVIGHSLGGYLALALVDQYPKSITGFGLFQSSTLPDDEAKKEIREKVKSFITENGVSLFAKNFVPRLFSERSKKGFSTEIAALTKEASFTRPDAVIHFSLAMKNRPDRTNLLSNFSKPIFIIGGDEDPAIPLITTQFMISKINIQDSLILKETGHNGFIEGRKESLDFIKAFLLKYSI